MSSRRRVLLGALVVVLLVGAAAAWVGYRALGARTELEAARTALTSLRSSATSADVEASRASLATLQQHSSRAHGMTHDPVWAAVAALPVAGDTAKTVRGLTEAVDLIAQRALPPLVEVAPSVTPESLRTGPDSVDVAALQGASTALSTASREVGSAETIVAGTPADVPVAQVSEARDELLGQLVDIGELLHRADLAARVLPAALGAEGRTRWMVALQTPAEARGTGGLLGGFGLVTADNGRVKVQRVGTNGDLPNVPSPQLDLPEGYLAQWGTWGPTGLWVNGGVSPDFPTAARIWAARWELAGVDVDGVLAVDPSVLGYVLESLGPVEVDGRTLAGADAAQFFLQDVYEEYPDLDERDAVQREFIETTFTKMFAGGGDARGLVEALVRGAQEGRVLAAMPGTREQDLLAREQIGGALHDEQDTPYLGVVVNDAGGSKLDPYTSREVTYRRGACTESGRTSTVSVTIGNEAPRRGLPDYVVIRADDGAQDAPRGQRRAYLSVYTTPGTELLGAELGGEPAALDSGTEGGFPVFSTSLELDPGETRTLTLRLSEPPRQGRATVRLQPLVRQPTVTVSDEPCDGPVN